MANLPPQQLNDEDLELLSAYIDGQLAAVERDLLEQRLDAEPPLRLALEELRATVAALRSLEPVRPPRSFTLDPAQVAPRGAGRFNLLRLLPLAGTMAVVLICAVVTIGVWSQGGLGGAGGGSTASAPLSAPAASAPTAAPETSAMQAPAAASEAMEAAPAEPPANADTAARAAPTPSPAGTLAPAATAAAAAPATGGQENTPAEPAAPMAAAEPTAKLESYTEGTPAPGIAAGDAPLAAQEDASVATPAGSSPDTVQLATPEDAAPPAAVTRPAVSPAVLIILPLLFLALGAWLYVVARRR